MDSHGSRNQHDSEHPSTSPQFPRSNHGSIREKSEIELHKRQNSSRESKIDLEEDLEDKKVDLQNSKKDEMRSSQNYSTRNENARGHSIPVRSNSKESNLTDQLMNYR